MPMTGLDDRAFDALLELAWLRDVELDVPSLSGPEPELDPADQRALDALGPDFVQRILREPGA